MIDADREQELEIFASKLIETEARLTALDATIARGLASAEAGRTKAAEKVFDRLEDKYRAMASATKRS